MHLRCALWVFLFCLEPEPSRFSIVGLYQLLGSAAEITHHVVCGKEYSHDTSDEETNKTYFNAGDIETVRCDATRSALDFEYENFPEEFITYPHYQRVCLNNGQWSGPIPICIRMRDNYISSQVKVEPGGAVDCLSSSSDCSPEWKQVGHLHSSCEEKQKKSNQGGEMLKKYELVFTFNRPHYFSFVTLQKTDVYDVELFAKKNSIIHSLSNKAAQFLHGHYDKWHHQQKEQNEHGDECCPVIEIPTYTDQLKVSYSTDKGPVKFHFYRIYDCFVNDENGEEECERCPKEPVIPNARLWQRSQDKRSIEYRCNDGYAVQDPAVTNKLVNATLINIWCIEGSWHPYPFPLCKKLHEDNSPIKEDNNVTCSNIALIMSLSLIVVTLPIIATVAFFLFYRWKSNILHRNSVQDHNNSPEASQMISEQHTSGA